MERRDGRRTKDSPGEIPVDKTVIGRGSSADSRWVNNILRHLST